MPVFPTFSILSALALNRVVPMGRRRMFFHAACAVGCVAVCLAIAFPPKARGEDIERLAPVAEANSAPGQRILFYTYEDGRRDFMWQFLWYGRRETELAENFGALVQKVQRGDAATAIMDKKSYEKLVQIVGERRVQVLGGSENLVCFRVE
jgi:hypothetical protein